MAIYAQRSVLRIMKSLYRTHLTTTLISVLKQYFLLILCYQVYYTTTQEIVNGFSPGFQDFSQFNHYRKITHKLGEMCYKISLPGEM